MEAEMREKENEGNDNLKKNNADLIKEAGMITGGP